MGLGHSRAGELNGAGLQARRHCFWCQNGRSFDDFYEPATTTTTSTITTTVTTCITNESVKISSECKRSLKCPITSGSGQQRDAGAVASGSKRFQDDTSNNSFPYSHFTHDTLMQIIRCFPFPSPRSSPEPSRSSTECGLANARSQSFDALQMRRPREIDRSCSVNDEKKCRSTNLAQVLGRSGRNSSRCEMAAVKVETQKCAVEKLALVSVDTMAITALPLDCWLKERLKNWIQLAGHEGTIVPATDQTLWKRRSCSDYNEGSAYRALMNDSVLDGFVPRYYREVEYKNESFIEIEDLTALFDDPAIMDIKMGTRTFLEAEVKNTTKRNDLYEKMIALNPDEPTEEEHKAKALTKMRYMQFREKESSSAALGFRIEAAKMPGGVLQKSFKKVRTREEVARTLWTFFGDHASTVCAHFLQRLQMLREALEKSFFFSTHEVIGSSLLLMYDATDANVWMIDFAKSLPVKKDSINHRQEWIYGNHEDGYLKGLDNLIEIMEELALR